MIFARAEKMLAELRKPNIIFELHDPLYTYMIRLQSHYPESVRI